MPKRRTHPDGRDTGAVRSPAALHSMMSRAFPDRAELLCRIDGARILRITEHNEAAPAVFGLEPRALLGAELRDLFTPDDGLEQDIERLCRAAGEAVETRTFLAGDGRARRVMELRLRSLEDEDGSLVVAAAVEGSAVAAPPELGAQMEGLGTILDAADISFTLLDPDFRIIGFNRRSSRNAQNVLGHTLEPGTSIRDIAAPGTEETLEDCLRRAFAGQVVSREWTFEPQSGPRSAFVFTYIPVVGRSGEVAAVVMATFDVSAIHRMREHDRELAVAVEQSPVAVLITDTDGTIEYVNPFFERQTGYSREEVQGENPRILSAGVLPAGTYAELWNRIRAGKTWQGEFVNRTKSGAVNREEAVIAPVLDDTGRPQRFVAIKQDITERHRALEELRRSEERFRALFDNSVDALYVHDLNGTIVDASRSAARITGYSVDELIGMHVGTLDAMYGTTPPPGLDVGEDRRPPDPGSSPLSFESVLRHRDGHTFPVSVSLDRIRLNGEEVILAAVRDLTVVRRAEEALRQSTERYRKMFTTSPVGILICTRDGTIVDTNPALVGVLESPGLLTEGNDTEKGNVFQVPVLRQSGISDGIARAMEQDGTTYGETEYEIRPGEGPRVVRFIATPTHGADGVVTGAQAFVEDFTLRRAAERRLSESLNEKDTLLREIHHRVKNNLQTISSLLRLQSDRVGDAAAHAALMNSVSRVQSMAMVHEKLYNTEHLERIRFDEYLQELGHHLSMLSSDEGAPARLSFDVEPTELSIDTALPLGLVANELISNAFKHAFGATADPRLSIGLERGETEIRLLVADNGRGMEPPAPDAPDASSSLGMQLIDALVRQLAGDIYFESDDGTAARVSVPVSAHESSSEGALG